MLTRTQLALVVVVSWCLSTTAHADAPTIAFKQRPGEISVFAGTHPVATYYYADAKTPRPYLAHVHAPCGTQVTRNHPPKPSDAQDHAALHPGVWLAFGDISGHDYWRLRARVVHERIVEPPAGESGRGSFAVLNRYLSTAGESTVCTETCRLSFRVRPTGYLILWDSTFTGDRHEFYFGDQEEMGLGVRLATALREDGGSGRVLSSEGRQGASATWGRTAAWCDYSGVVDGQHLGITIMAAPSNIRPTWWHNRGYGFFAANLFGRQAMRQGPPSKIVVKQGQQFRLQYAVHIHSSPPGQQVDLVKAHDDYRRLLLAAE